LCDRTWHECRRLVSAVLDRLRLGTSGALLSSDDDGSSVERDEGGHPLCGG
jgi:hypothetical protein